MKRFDPQLIILENVFAESCDQAGTAGFWKNEWIPWDLRRRSSPGPLNAADARALGWKTNQKQLNELSRVADGWLDRFAKIARGYAGWLLTNRQFLDEHDQLLERWADMVQCWGLKDLGILLPTGMPLPQQDPTTDPKWAEYKAEFESFLVRWRLQSLTAPYLPIPLRPLLGGEFPASVRPQVNRAGGTFAMPDTFPVGTRDGLQDMLTEAIQRPKESEHLREWLKIVSRDNPARKPIAQFERLLQLQHYWRIVHHRHAQAIRRKLKDVKEVFARFLEASPETIHRDLLLLTKRLGKGWVDRGAGSPFGPF